MKYMTIKLVRYGACKDCPAFELEVDDYELECFCKGSTEYIRQYEVRCKHERACSYMRDLMQKEGEDANARE